MNMSGRCERPDRRQCEAKPRDAGNGEGAASALATLRDIECSRMACAPVDEVQPPPAQRRRGRAKAAP